MKEPEENTMTWVRAGVGSLLIIAYLVVTTVWVPNAVVELGAVAEASSFVRDAIVSVVWAAALAGGLYGLRLAQRKGLI